MADQRTLDPYESFKNFSDQWEKQVNDMINLSTNNQEFIGFSKAASELQGRYLKMFQKNQELLAAQLNLPTKKDLANVAKLSIQTEEKIDSLEEQIWNLQESVDSTNKEINSIVEVSREIIKLTKQLKTEQMKYKKELEKASELRSELAEVKSELAEIYSLKEEIVNLKKVMFENIDKQVELEQELELTVTSK
jgi:polyhydroxyalkanoic acid synthase PhaR subunit